MNKVVISCDHGAVDLKKEIVSFFQKKNYEVKIMGAGSTESVDYPDVTVAACNEFKKGGYEFGVLMCGTGIGVTMAANKVRGIRCALISDLFTAEMAKAHNDANFIAFGGRIQYAVPVTEMIEKFMTTTFAGDRHQRRIAKIMAIEDQC